MLVSKDELDTIEMTSASTRNSTLADSHNPVIDPLTQYGPFAFIPYLPSSSPITSQPAFHLNNTSTWTYCGPILSPTSATNLPPSFSTWASATLSSPSALVQRLLPLLSFLNTFLQDAGARHYWLAIRATKPTSEYDTPRWHVDEDFFEMGMGVGNSSAEEAALLGKDKTQATQGSDGANKTCPRRWKLAATLLGPPTLFQSHQSSALGTLHSTRESSKHTLDMSSHTCTSIRCIGCSTYASHVRCCLARCFSSSPTISSTANEISFFRIGQAEGAVHSEPKCDVDRVFVNVVPGTEGELKELMGRWGMGFPRAWCFGVPVNFGLVDAETNGECGEGKEQGNSSSSSSSSNNSIKDSAQKTRSVAESKLEKSQGPTNDHDDDEGNYNEPQTQQQYQRPPFPLLSPSPPETKPNNTSTMTANLSPSCIAWLSRNGLNVEKVFGAG